MPPRMPRLLPPGRRPRRRSYHRSGSGPHRTSCRAPLLHRSSVGRPRRGSRGSSCRITGRISATSRVSAQAAARAAARTATRTAAQAQLCCTTTGNLRRSSMTSRVSFSWGSCVRLGSCEPPASLNWCGNTALPARSRGRRRGQLRSPRSVLHGHALRAALLCQLSLDGSIEPAASGSAAL